MLIVLITSILVTVLDVINIKFLEFEDFLENVIMMNIEENIVSNLVINIAAIILPYILGFLLGWYLVD